MYETFVHINMHINVCTFYHLAVYTIRGQVMGSKLLLNITQTYIVVTSGKDPKNSRNPHSLIILFSKKSHGSFPIFHQLSENWLFPFLCMLYSFCLEPYKHTCLTTLIISSYTEKAYYICADSVSLKKFKYLYRI